MLNLDNEVNAIQAFMVSEAAVQHAQAKLDEVDGALKHWHRMCREYGQTHPIATQAHHFALTLYEQSQVATRIATSMHDLANQQFNG